MSNGYNSYLGHRNADIGSISPDRFTFRGATVQVTVFEYRDLTDGEFLFLVEKRSGPTPSGGFYGDRDYTLHVGSETRAIDSPGSNRRLAWRPHGLNWSTGQMIAVKLTTEAPDFESAEVPAAGTHIYLTMEGEIDLTDGRRPLPDAFSITANGYPIKVEAVETRTGVTDGLALRLATRILKDETVLISYTDPDSTSNDVAALQDTEDVDVVSFKSQSVTNNSTRLFSFDEAKVPANGEGIELIFDRNLGRIGNASLLKSAFSVQVNGQTREMGAPTLSSPKVVTLPYRGYGPEIYQGDKVTASYDRDAAGSAALVTRNGNVQAESFTDVAVTNSATQTRFYQAFARGSKLLLFFHVWLDGNSVPAPEDFTVKVNGTANPVLSAVMGGDWMNSDMVLHLQDPVPAGATVTVSYAKGANPLQDRNSPAEILPFTDMNVKVVSSDVTRPVLESAELLASDFGQTIILTFSETLSGSEPPQSAFEIKVDGRTQPLTSAEGVKKLDVFANQISLIIWRRKSDGGDRPASPGSNVTVSYTRPDDGVLVIEDLHGNDALSFADRTVTLSGLDQQLGDGGTGDPLLVVVESPPLPHDGDSDYEIRLAFSEALHEEFSFETLLSHAFTLEGGSIKKVGRVNRTGPERNKRWKVTIKPSGSGDVVLTLNPGPACGQDHAICGVSGARLAGSVPITIPGPPVAPLTAKWTEWPGGGHDGSSAFETRLQFSEGIWNSWTHVKRAVTASGGTVNWSKRVEGKSDLWRLRGHPQVLGDLHGRGWQGAVEQPGNHDSGSHCDLGGGRLGGGGRGRGGGLHGEPEPAHAGHADRRLRDRGGHGHGGDGLHADHGHAHLRAE